jgi:hypothetical protein
MMEARARRTRRISARVAAALAVSTVVVVGGALFLAWPSDHSATLSRTQVPFHIGPGQRANASLVAERTAVHRAQASIRRLENAPGMPACAPPSIPPATYPPGNTYGLPFLAAITHGEILTGYDEWTANHPIWTVGSTTYHLDPWQAKVYDISGWVTGLLQLPNLSADISSEDVVFCDQGGQRCVSSNPPVGQCIHVNLSGAPQADQPPPPTITNDPPPGHRCYQAANFCIPYIATLTPVGTSRLTVTGVEPDGALMLSVTTSAVTALSVTFPGASEACEDKPTTITLSTQEPASLPPGAPIKPKRGDPDLRGLQTPPEPLTGPLASGSSVVASNDFSVPAFSQQACPLLAAVFDSPLAGWNKLSPEQPASVNNNYFDKTPPPADAGTPGWVQFSATTTVSSLGIPVGPPPGFSIGAERQAADGT